ncbi:MAG: c-type cytochrome [Verrucomicrobia bacterium]|nr:c-type cytochrome [Verrucomicrobiota bacterium]
MKDQLFRACGFFSLAFFVWISPINAATLEVIAPVGKDGKPLNLDFEVGTLKDWTATGKAFEGQPIKGDTVTKRRTDMRSQHTGNFWIGTYEIAGDEPQGTLTSVPFKVTQPFASFLVAGGLSPNTRVELVRADTERIFFKTSGTDSENLRPVVVDLQPHLGKEIFIRILDQASGGWGHINFDDFKLYAQRPKFDNELDPAKVAADAPPADVVPYAGLSPADAAKFATLPPGFKMHVFAGEPDIVQPIAFCLDDRGRVWVAEGLTYPIRAPEGQGKDRILVFEDTNGDHKFDKRTVFMEGLNLVSGLEYGFGGIWVGAAPYLMFIPIQDSDAPKPAGPPQILLDGWDYKRDTHETLNTFTWGPDGWLYGCHGVFCPSHVGKPGAPESERQWMDAGVWRYHPTKHIFEVFAEGTSNPWGIDFDEHGQLWEEACVIPHLWHMIQGGRYLRQGGEHFSINRDETARNEKHRENGSRKPIFPYVYEDIQSVGDHVHYAGNKGPHAGNARSDAAGGGHAHAGMMVYLGDSWPTEYRGNLFMGNIHGQRLNMDIPERSGSGYVGHHGKDFLNFNDTWSQTLNQLYDQDGSVYIIDWYDKNQCHHTNPDGHDRSNGRIYKIVYNDRKVTKVDLQREPDEALLFMQWRQMGLRSEWAARHARRILQERAANGKLKTNIPEQIAKEKLRMPMNEVEALHFLQVQHSTIGILEDEALKILQRSDYEFLRAWTVQLICESKSLSTEASKEFVRLAREDKSPVVRLYLASALQRLSPEQRWDIYTALLQHSEDANDHNIPLMVWYGGEVLAATQPVKALSLAVTAKLPKILNFTTRRIAQLGTAEARDLIAETLAKLDDSSKQLDMLTGLSAALKGQRSVPMPQGWEKVEAKLSASSNPQIRALAQSLSLTFGSANALAALKKTLMDESAEAGARRTALDSLLSTRDASLPLLLQQLLKSTDLRGQAIRALAGYDDSNTPDAILGVYASLGTGETRDALNTLASRAAFAKPMLASVESGTIPRNALTAEIIRQLRNLKNADIDQQLQKVYGTIRDSSADKKKEIEKYKRIYYAGGSQPGIASRGRAVFDKICAQCHTLFDTGGKVGPDLTGSNRADLDYILQNILDPNAVIPNDYRASTIETKDGRSLIGIVKQQDDKSVTVATQTETLVLPRNEIQSQQQSELSMMPEGLLAPLADQEIRDLIYYLSRPGQVPLPASAQ